MKKVKVVTYCTWTSIGSILQALALKKTLENEECESVILLNRDDNQLGKIKVHSFKSLLKRVFEILNHNKKMISYKKRMRFIDKHISIKYFDQYHELEKMAGNDDTDYYIAGSDQIWNPDWCNPVFFLDFVQNKRCISYAASMGKTEIHPDKIDIMKNYLENFEHLSVREQACVDALQKLTNKEITVNIDPTFLISADEWRKYEKAYDVKKTYILLYMLYWDDSCREKIRTLKQKTGIPVYAISNGLSGVYADKVFYDVGVEEFLWLIDHAEYVITSSFHGVAFSTIFNKTFSAVINPLMPSRIQNIMKLLSIPLLDITDLNQTNPIDYQIINEAIEKERERGIQYLREAMK